MLSFIENFFPKTLHRACELNNIRAVKRHLAAGADVNAKGEYGFTPLHAVCGRAMLWFGHMDIIELLIAEGADLNAKADGGVTPLHRAVSSGHENIVKLLIAEGADLNAKDINGMTPSDVAIDNHRSKFSVLLSKHGGKSTGRTMLKYDIPTTLEWETEDN